MKPGDEHFDSQADCEVNSEQFDSFSFLIEHLNTVTQTGCVTPCVGLLLPLLLIRPPPRNNSPPPLPSVSLSGLINLLPPSLPPLFLLSHLLLTLLHSFLPFLCSIPFYSFMFLPLLLRPPPFFLPPPSPPPLPSVSLQLSSLCVLLTSSLEVVRSWLTYFSERRRHTYHLISITPRQA